MTDGVADRVSIDVNVAGFNAKNLYSDSKRLSVRILFKKKLYMSKKVKFHEFYLYNDEV